MKRIMICLLCVVMCFGLVGCNSAKKEAKNAEAKEALTKVLNNEASFTAKNPFTGEITEGTLENRHLPTAGNDNYIFIPGQYVFVDLDADAIEELVVLDAVYVYYMVLRYDAEQIRGYMVGTRSMIDLKTDGSFSTSSGFSENTVSTMTFDGAEFEIHHKASESGTNKEYLVDGKLVDEETLNNYFKEWNKSTTEVTWTKIG